MKLPPVKARIVAAVRRNRECSGEWLFEQIYRGRSRPNRSVLKAHIWQLRKAGFPIIGDSRTPATYVWAR